MGTSNVSRTMKELRKIGTKCAVVEKWNGFAGPHGIRQDLFGIIDVIGLDPERGVMGIQCCSGSGYSAHFKKLTEERAQETTDWLETPGTSLFIWAWRKVVKQRGGKARVWKPRVVEITLEDVQ
jgi:hypothetical protein